MVAILLIVIASPAPRPQPLPKPIGLLARLAFTLPRLEPITNWSFGDWNDRDPRAQLRQRLWWWAHRRAYDGPVTTDWYLGLKFNHHLAGDVSFCTYVNGRYEPNEMCAVAGLLRPGMTFVDVGANEGLFTLLASRLIGPTGAVHAFEPSPREAGRLAENIDLNGLANVRVHRVALGAAQGTAVLHVADVEHPGHNTLGGLVYHETKQAYSVDVPVLTLDQVADQEGFERLDLLKIDVEGSETAVLKGAQGVLRRFRPALLTEAQDESLRHMGSSVSELVELLRKLDYAVWAFGESGRPEPVIDDKVSSLNIICLPQGTDLPAALISRGTG